MPSMRLGATSNYRASVVRALESVAGVPHGSGGDDQWIRQLVELINNAHGTDMKYKGENWGYEVEYNSPKSAVLLGEIKQQNNL
jgi:hypothetical protein